MGMIKEFKEFAMKGNLVDMAIAVVMAGAFGKVVSAFIDGMVMPLVGMLTGGVDFSNLYFGLTDKTKEAATSGVSLDKAKEIGAVFAYGKFITVAIEFLIVAFVMFMVIKAMNKMKKKQEEAPAAPPEPSSTDKLLMEIRDSLKK